MHFSRGNRVAPFVARTWFAGLLTGCAAEKDGHTEWGVATKSPGPFNTWSGASQWSGIMVFNRETGER